MCGLVYVEFINHIKSVRLCANGSIVRIVNTNIPVLIVSAIFIIISIILSVTQCPLRSIARVWYSYMMLFTTKDTFITFYIRLWRTICVNVIVKSFNMSVSTQSHRLCICVTLALEFNLYRACVAHCWALLIGVLCV